MGTRIFKHLTFTDRLRIEDMLKKGKSKREIADYLHVHISTIYNEIKRGVYEHLNSDYTTEIRYSPDIADAKYRENLAAKGPDLKIGKDHALAECIENLIVDEKYSPVAALEKIKRMDTEFSVSICRATLYSYIDKGVFLRLTNKKLPQKGKKKRPYNKVRRAARPPRGESIEMRPNEINSRSTCGHWEMDTVVGRKKSKKVLLVLTERKTRNEIIRRLPDKSAASVIKALDGIEREYGGRFSQVFRTITVDNGSEFSDCAGIEKSIHAGKQRTKLYYCHPYSAYERGSNENQNGLIRRWFPKGTSFDRITKKKIEEVERWLNDYPREILGFDSAGQRFSDFLYSIGE